MNPLLGRLFENRARSKTKNVTNEDHRRNKSMDRALVPKIPAKVKLQSLGDIQVDRRLSTIARSNIGKLPSLPQSTNQDVKEHLRTRNNFRNRKLSTSIRDMDGHFFSTQLQDGYFPTEQESPEPKMSKELTFQKKVEEIVEKEEGNEEQQLFEYLKVLETNQELNEQFCYMNRRSFPYSFYIVDYADRNKDEYLTVSLRGITYFKQEDSQFYAISKFSREIELFKQIKQINFFGDYLRVKVIQHWKQIMLRRKFNLKCRFIISHLFSQNLMVQSYMHFLHGLAQDYSGGIFFNFSINLTLSLAEFNKKALIGADELIKSIKKFDDLIEKTLRSTVEKMLSKFRGDERVSIGSRDKSRQDQSYLPFDAKRRSMKYTQMAKLKQFQWLVYRLIKYTDMVRFNVKIQLIRRCYQSSIGELVHLKYASENKETIRFTNWMQMELGLEGSAGNATLVISPSIEQIQKSIAGVKQYILTQIFSEHRLLIDKKETFSCENLEFQDEEKPSKFDLKYYALKQSEFIQLQKKYKIALKEIVNKIQAFVLKCQNSLAKIYNKNAILGQVTAYLSNLSLTQYLQVYRNDYNQVSGFEDTFQFALTLVKVDVVRQMVRRSAQQKYKVILNAVPAEVISRCQILQDKIRVVLNRLKENPSNIQDYIIFSKRLMELKPKVPELQAQMDEILDFQLLVYKYGIRIGQTAKLSITDVQTLFKQLTHKFQQVEQNEQKERKKFEALIDDMIPAIQQKSQELLKQLTLNGVINNHSSDVSVATLKIKSFLQIYEKLNSRKEELFQYQRQLDLGHRQLQLFDKMESTINALNQVWKARSYYFIALKFIETQGYGKINQLEIGPLKVFISSSDRYSACLQCFELLHQFKQSIVSLLKIINISKLLSDETLMPQHINQMKQILKSYKQSHLKIELLFLKEGKNTITPSKIWKETNASQLQDQLSEIVFFASQQSKVKSQLTEIEQFWKKNKIQLISEHLAQNELLILHLDRNEDIHQKLGYFVVTLKNMEGSPHVVGVARDRAVLNAKMCNYIRELLWIWQRLQKLWVSLLPVMVNCPAVKHQSNVFFEFTSADTTIKKFIRTVSEMLSLKRLCDDHHEHRYYNMLQQMEKQLTAIAKTFNNFLEMKRVTYGRFCFMSDYELIQILQHAKDAVSVSPYIGYCFNARKLQLDGMLMAAFEHPNQVYKMRKIILKGEPDEIFKNIQENMKHSFKLMVKIMLPKMRLSLESQSLQNDGITQAILISDKLFWTQISQSYLNTMTYPQYKLLLKRQQQKIADYLKQVQKPLWLQTALRLSQLMYHREIGMQLIRDQITPGDFKWKEQIRMYGTEEDLFVCHFDGKIAYSCEYRPPTQINVPTNTSTRFLYESYRACLLGQTLSISGGQGQGKRSLIEQASSVLGTYNRQVICSRRLTSQFLLKIVQGVMAAGAWISFYQFDNLNFDVCAELLGALRKNNTVEHKINSPLFMLVYHGKKVQQISIYNFNNYAVIEPEKEKICQWLLNLNRFKNYSDLSARIISFLKISRPFLNKALSNELGMIRHVIDKASKIMMRTEDKHISELEIIARVLRDEVILKEEQSKTDSLSKALFGCFGISITLDLTGGLFDQKVDTLANLITLGTPHIIVLGERSCKSTAIKYALQKAEKELIKLYPTATQIFFTPEFIDFLHTVPKGGVLVCDGNEVLVQWADLIIAGFLFIENKKAILQNQTIMQLRTIEKCSPSFVGRCQILYIGTKALSKWSKISKSMSQNHYNYSVLREALIEIFGKSLQSISDDNLSVVLSIIVRIPSTIGVKNMVRLIIWICALLGSESLWTRSYGGEYSEFTLSNSFELVAVESNVYQSLIYPGFKNYFLVPTKSSTVIMNALNHLLQANLNVHFLGSSQSGKTSLMHMINRKLILSCTSSSEQWGQTIKKRFTYVRRECQHWLIDSQAQGTRFVVDDLDLGIPYQREYIRQLLETKAFRDSHFDNYLLEKIQFIGFSRSCSIKQKYWSQVAQIRLPSFQKESVEIIFRQNMARHMTQFSMNRQVQDFVTGKVIKAAGIAIDDICNAIGLNQSSSLLLSLLRNLLSLPKKQAFMSVENYLQFFKIHFHSKLHERSQNRRLLWQIKTVEQNILKVIFLQEQKNQDFSVNFDGQYRIVNRDQIQEMIKKEYPQIILFDRLLDTVVYLCNQVRCMDKNVILLGKRGTGKRFLVQICSKLTGIPIVLTISEAILAALRHQKVIFIEQLQESQTIYENFQLMKVGKDIEKLIETDKRQMFYRIIAGDESTGKVVERCKQYINFMFLCDDEESYESLCLRRHQIYNMPVCLIEEWPAEAILNLYTINDQSPALHAELFTKFNAAMSELKIPNFSLKIFQKYLKVFYELFEKGTESIKSQLKINRDISMKFNQSFQLLSAWEGQVDVLRREIEESIAKSGENIAANEVSNMILAIFLGQIKEEQQKSAKQQQELKVLNRQIQKRLQFIQSTLHKIQSIVAAFHRTELGQLKKIYKANRIVHFGVQCLCLLLKQENSDEKTINKILADPNLLMRMKAPDLLQNRNRELQVKFKKTFSEELQAELQDSDVQLCKTLIEWIKSMIQYWQACEKQRIQNQKYEKAKFALSESTKKHSELHAQVKSTKQIIEQKLAVIEYETELKAAKEVELSSMSMRLQNANKIIPILKKQALRSAAIIQKLEGFQVNLRGNCILAAVTTTFVSLQPLNVKQKLLQVTKKVLKQNLIRYSNHFIRQISNKQIESIQHLNYLLLELSNLPKVVFDPHRKFLLFLQQNSTEEVRESVVENSENVKQFQANKIYHTTTEYKGNMENVLIIDWSAIAIEERQMIFLKFAEFKRPQYFDVKKQLQIKISRNLSEVLKLKDKLYESICEKEIKIIEDVTFIELGSDLQKLQRQTEKLKHLADEKISEIKHLTEQINEQVSKIIQIYDHLKFYRKINLDLVLDICCREGDAVGNFVRWALANIPETKWTSLLISLVVSFNKEVNLEILKDIVIRTPLRDLQATKIKKPSLVSAKNWEIALKLSNYSGNLKKLPECILKMQKEFQEWCIDQLVFQLPIDLFPQKLEFIEHLAMIVNFKPKTQGYLVYQLIKKHFNYTVSPFSAKQLILMTNPKFPVIVYLHLDQIKKLNQDLNQGRMNLSRMSKIGHETEMKKVVWKSMQAKQWLICYDIQNKKDLLMLQSICYYVMNYDKQEGFRVFIVIDSFQNGQELTIQQKLIKKSVFISNVCPYIYRERISCDSIISENCAIEYQVSVAANQSFTSNKQYFNRMFKMIAICYSVLWNRYPNIKMSFKRMVETLQYIKLRLLAVEFNVFTIVNFLSRVMSHQVNDIEQRKVIEETWDLIVDERKMTSPHLLGVPMEGDKFDGNIQNNLQLTGCQLSHFIRQCNFRFKDALSGLYQIYQCCNREQLLAFIRVQLGRLPILITGKQMLNNNFSYFYNSQVGVHNEHLIKAKQWLIKLNEVSSKDEYLQTLQKNQNQKIVNFMNELSLVANEPISLNVLKVAVAHFINKVKIQHEFLLYFNPNLPKTVIDSTIVNNLELMTSSYFINYIQANSRNDAHKLVAYLDFCNIFDVKSIINPGLYLQNLKCKEFYYHYESKSIGPSLQVDGLEMAPLLRIDFREPKVVEGQVVEDLDIQIFSKNRSILWGSVDYSTVYVEWGLRGSRLLADDPDY